MQNSELQVDVVVSKCNRKNEISHHYRKKTEKKKTKQSKNNVITNRIAAKRMKLNAQYNKRQ